ncbi:hypothetical protein FHT77_003896 [Rhizobium sp. BK181]|nr:hypothetical protein [Rhizobium sp. BK181]
MDLLVKLVILQAIPTRQRATISSCRRRIWLMSASLANRHASLPASSSRLRSTAEATASLTPRLGRARPLAEKSIGHPDAGAISLAMIAACAAMVLAAADEPA